MLSVTVASEAGDPAVANEDWAQAGGGLVVVLDGATVRTGTGCRHGVPWYVATLGPALVRIAADRTRPLPEALADAIRVTADRHRDTCDLDHPGTPSAATAVLRVNGGSLEHLVLGDVTIVLDTDTDTDTGTGAGTGTVTMTATGTATDPTTVTGSGTENGTMADTDTDSAIRVISDDRVERTALAERARADREPYGSPAKRAALLAMKHAELAARNRPGGYWIAAADPGAAAQALPGAGPLATVRRMAVLTDGAARLVMPFAAVDWSGVLDLLDRYGPAELIRRVRTVEASDPYGVRWPRNKRSDDATVAYVVH